MAVDLIYILGVGHSGSALLDMILGRIPESGRLAKYLISMIGFTTANYALAGSLFRIALFGVQWRSVSL